MKTTAVSAKPAVRSIGRRRNRRLGRWLLALLLLFSFAICGATGWYVSTYGQLGFEAVLYTLTADLGGVQSDLVRLFWEDGLRPALQMWAVVCVLLVFRPRKTLVLIWRDRRRFRLFPVRRTVSLVLCLAISGVLLAKAAGNLQLMEYVIGYMQRTTIYEDEYADPAAVQIHAEEKRNLIYIYLESMETTYLSVEEGGASEAGLIPELYQLAQQNVNLSHNDAVGGAVVLPGSGWTIAAMVSHTAGVPLKTPPGVTGNEYGSAGESFLPGVVTLTDILREQGYYQTLMVGSDAKFGGRYEYYTQHGVDHVYDLFTAYEDGIVPHGYGVWWGFEDFHLFEYAKQELTRIAQQDQPFAFTMLTVDTHHVSGYLCEFCGSEYAEQYENVMACASRQVYDFVEWLQQQPFYETTTIVISGDHLSMDADYFLRNYDEPDRRVYNCIINAADGALAGQVNTKNRVFTTLDMFPTTLAAMGFEIEGERLGLGTNLFSGRSTLCEEWGLEEFVDEMAKMAPYYNEYFY